jgi:hypothetical protein
MSFAKPSRSVTTSPEPLARSAADLHGYETDDADQMKRADRVDLASWVALRSRAAEWGW